MTKRVTPGRGGECLARSHVIWPVSVCLSKSRAGLRSVSGDSTADRAPTLSDSDFNERSTQFHVECGKHARCFLLRGDRSSLFGEDRSSHSSERGYEVCFKCQLGSRAETLN